MDQGPALGVRDEVHYDDEKDQIIIVSKTTNIEHLIRENRAMRDLNGKGLIRNGGNLRGGALARPVAELDFATYQTLQTLGITEDDKAMRRWLNDPDNRGFRTSEGNL